uniref:Protein kinase domain-containing protein n=1 Tax=Steinernema glaseri TaxID=37863 RepID=A0A1I7YBU5_9BILA
MYNKKEIWPGCGEQVQSIGWYDSYRDILGTCMIEMGKSSTQGSERSTMLQGRLHKELRIQSDSENLLSGRPFSSTITSRLLSRRLDNGYPPTRDCHKIPLCQEPSARRCRKVDSQYSTPGSRLASVFDADVSNAVMDILQDDIATRIRCARRFHSRSIRYGMLQQASRRSSK